MDDKMHRISKNIRNKSYKNRVKNQFSVDISRSSTPYAPFSPPRTYLLLISRLQYQLPHQPHASSKTDHSRQPRLLSVCPSCSLVLPHKLRASHKHSTHPNMPLTAHSTLESFYASVPSPPQKEKVYTLIVSLSPSRGLILLGKKLRGFGQGLYNGFGGKPDGPDEPLLDCACREMLEESGVEVRMRQREAAGARH